MVRVLRATQVEIDTAVQTLREGGLVAFPTETVYGLGANASNPTAVRRVFEAKGRPASHPLIVHLAAANQLSRWVREIPEVALRLAEAFWPGPLTLVLPRALTVSDLVTGGQDTVAVRVPSHPMARQLLSGFGGGVVAPSANRFGRVSPTRAEHVREELRDGVDIILDGGECHIGLESTIVAFEGPAVRLLRPGGISAAQLRSRIGDTLLLGASLGSPRVPGSTASHYAPSTPLTVVPAGEIDHFAATLSEGGRRVAVLAQRLPHRAHKYVTWINAGSKPEAYARDLYANLRTLDKAGCRQILVQDVPRDERWEAICDRLTRAASALGEQKDNGALAV
jgi:L-threonylcarbamoyladenylate synthase